MVKMPVNLDFYESFLKCTRCNVDILAIPGMGFFALNTSLPFSNNCLTNAVNCSLSMKKFKDILSTRSK
jgi:hypothetical protein